MINCNNTINKFLILFALLIYCYAFVKNSGPEVKPTVGEVWPIPKYVKKSTNFLFIDPNNFKFLAVTYTCDILEHALERYTKIIKLSINSRVRDIEKELKLKFFIQVIAVNLTAPCEKYPYLSMNEYYALAGYGKIKATSIWGILRGLETYSQLITPGPDGMLQIHNVVIRDWPRFDHRGLLLDTSRHFISVDTIFTILDGMAYDKLNVFHWLLINMDSFSYQSINFPQLTQDSAYMSSMVYTQQNITNIVEYARLRGIRVIPEFDLFVLILNLKKHYFFPGMMKQYEHVNDNSNITTSFNEKLLNYINTFFNEVHHVFPDQFINLGNNLISTRNLLSTTSTSYIFYNKYLTRIITSLLLKNYKPIIIQNVSKFLNVLPNNNFFNNSKSKNLVEESNLPTDTIIQVKVKNDSLLDIVKLIDLGHYIISSGCWTLNDLSIEAKDFFYCESLNLIESVEDAIALIGGEAIMWSQYANDNNVVQTIFPKLSITAAKLWSPADKILWVSQENADVRAELEEHICRLIVRGIYASPILGPGICG